MIQIIFGSFLLSIVHALIPNHWIPLVAISRTEKWPRKDTLFITALVGSAHTLSTIIVGIVIGLVGFKLSSSYQLITHVVAPLILIILGLVFLFIDFRKNSEHHHHHFEVDNNKSKYAIVISLMIAMFFSPCMEIEAYFFTAGSLGWVGIGIVSLIYFFVTVLGMVFFVFLGLKGIEKLNLHFLEHHEKMITGIILIVLGILAYFIHF